MKKSVLGLLVFFLLAGCGPNPRSAPSGTAGASLPGTASPLGIGRRTKTSGCVSRDALPDPACTPGAIFPSATKDQICTPGYSQNVRDVPEAEKNEVYAEYGVTHHGAGEYEVDHLISLELGGSNDIANLWPEPAEPRPGFHEKDQVENRLHDLVCRGAMPLSEAQARIATNWRAFYDGAALPPGYSAPTLLTPVSGIAQPTPTPGAYRFVASSRAKEYYYCEGDPAWHSLSPNDLVWSDNESTFQAKGLVLHSPCR